MWFEKGGVIVGKNGFSKTTLTVIDSVWFFFIFVAMQTVADTYHLNLWIEVVIGVPLLIIGQTLIRKFIKVNE